MELLRASDVTPDPGERVFRHGLAGPMALWCAFAAPLAFAVVARAELAHFVATLPWFLWAVVAPIVLLGSALWLLVLHATGQVVHRALSASNWLMRVSPAGLVLHVRSFQNSHFPDDGPTVVRFAWREIAGARRVRDTTRRHEDDPARATRWLEIELAGVDTTALDRLIAHERERPAPVRSFLGVSGRARLRHVPVFVPRPGAVRTDWLGRAMLRELARHVAVGEELRIDRADDALESRVRALVVQGDLMAAQSLVRSERRVSLVEARKHVEALARAPESSADERR